MLFSGIALFRKTLKELYINGHCTQYFSLPLLLGVLPVLTHLTVKLKRDRGYKPSEYDKSISREIRQRIQSSYDDNNNNKIHNIVFLSLDSESNHNFHIKQVLTRCPRLKYLLVSNSTINDYTTSSAIDFSLIPELCPSIRYIHWGEGTKTRTVEKKWLTMSREKRIDTDKRTNSDYEKGEANYLCQVEFNNNDEERHIATLTACLQQPSLLEHLRLSTSTHLDLYQIWKRFTQRNSDLLSRLSQLKSLELVGFRVPYQTENDMFFNELFSYVPHIERLKMDFFVIPVNSLVKERDYTRKVVEALGHHLRQLRYLYLDFTCRGRRAPRMDLCDNLYMILCDWNQKLEILHLTNVPISNDMLLNLCRLFKLHTLNLSGYDLHKHLTEDGWISFARKLKEQEQNGSSGLKSMLLSCGYSDDVTDRVLEEFAGIQSLETLRIACNEDITDAGINKFASIASSIGKKHKIIEIDTCIQISLDNPHVILVHSPY